MKVPVSFYSDFASQIRSADALADLASKEYRGCLPPLNGSHDAMVLRNYSDQGPPVSHLIFYSARLASAR